MTAFFCLQGVNYYINLNVNVNTIRHIIVKWVTNGPQQRYVLILAKIFGPPLLLSIYVLWDCVHVWHRISLFFVPENTQLNNGEIHAKST